jgi:DNA-directed RNA polymerase subunit RPC12/RpoP
MSYVYRCIRCYAEIGEKTFMWHCSTCRIQDTMKEVSEKSNYRKNYSESDDSMYLDSDMMDTFRRMGIRL